MSSKTRTRKTNTTATGSASTLRSVPDPETAATVRTDTEDKLWKALHTNPNSTAADLSGVAEIGKSTAQKILVKWASEGSVTRTAGIAEGGRRAADLWAIADTDVAPVDQVDTAPAEDADPAETVPDSPVTPDEADVDDTATAEGDVAESANTAPTVTAADKTEPADAEPAVAEETDTAADGATTDTGTATSSTKDDKARLAPGALRGMVEDHLRDHPSEEFGPTAIAKALSGKSSGAVSNALDKLVEDGVAVKTNDKPRRFTLAPAETAAPAPTN